MKLFQGARIPLREESFISPRTAQFYDEHARRFMGVVYRHFAAKAARISPSTKNVLDIGTGSGLSAIELAKARPDWHITGIDISVNMLKLARENAFRAGVADRVDFRQSSAVTLPFPDNSFSIVASNASLHLWADPLKVFAEVARVTAPGGYFLLWDNLRVAVLYPFLRLLGWMMGMNPDQRRLWLQAVQSSYTFAEAKALLRKSAHKNARVSINPFLLELEIIWRNH